MDTTTYNRQDGTLHRKSFTFAVRIVKMVSFLRDSKGEHVLTRQILRAGTAIGALVREAEFAQSIDDFANKLSIALKEANETDYWLSLLRETDYLQEEAYKSIAADCNELIALLIASIKTAKAKKK